jgi:hypothetical protein
LVALPAALAYRAEFHAWPSAAAATWLILASAYPALFPAQS